MEPSKTSCVSILIKTLENIDDENDDVVERSLRELITNALDTFDIATNKITKETKNLNDFLIKNIEKMKGEIINFVNNNIDSKVTKKSLKKFTSYINNLGEWAIQKSQHNIENKVSDVSLYTITNFIKTSINYIVSVFPNIILNKVDYNNINVPKYWKLSQRHSSDIKNILVNFMKF